MRKKHHSFFFSAILFLGINVFGTDFTQPAEITILHTNDTHARYLGREDGDISCSLKSMNQSKCYGGFDRLFTKIKEVRSKEKNVLLLDAGDQFQGSAYYLIYKGDISAELMNRLGYDAMTAGNHEFDNGAEVFRNFIKLLNFPLVSANIDVTRSNELRGLILPYVILKRGGQKIGVLGLTTPETRFLSSPGENVKFNALIPSAKKAVADLKKLGVDLIIAVSHSGLGEDKKVAQNVDGIGLIVSGHTNSLLSNTDKNADGPCPMVVHSPNKNPVLLVSAYAYTKYLGYIKIRHKNGVPVAWEGNPILLDSKIKRDRTINRYLVKKYQPILALEKRKVGHTPVLISGAQCRFQECAIGNFLTDSMLRFTKPLGVDIAFMNGGGIRASIPKGPVNQAQVNSVLPFEKKIVLLKLSGSEIKNILEHGTKQAHDKQNVNTGRFLQVAGLRYSADLTKAPGQRIKHIEVLNKEKKYEPLILEKIYSVVTHNYLADGGDDYTMFKKSQEKWSLELDLKNILESFFKSSNSQLPMIEGRIKLGSTNILRSMGNPLAP